VYFKSSETAMGVKLDEMAEKGDRYRENFSQIEECFIRRLSNPLLWGDKLFEMFAAKDFASALDVVHRFSSEIIAKRRDLLKDELDKSSSTADDDGYVNWGNNLQVEYILINVTLDLSQRSVSPCWTP